MPIQPPVKDDSNGLSSLIKTYSTHLISLEGNEDIGPILGRPPQSASSPRIHEWRWTRVGTDLGIHYLSRPKAGEEQDPSEGGK